MAKLRLLVIWSDGKWKVKPYGKDRAIFVSTDKGKAISKAVILARLASLASKSRRSRVSVHTKAGTVDFIIDISEPKDES